jgi:hypothetical protein
MAASRHVSQRLSLDDVDAYHKDAVSALHTFFQGSSGDFAARYSGYSSEEIEEYLTIRLDETDVMFALR